MITDEKIIFGIRLGSILIGTYFIYQAISQYQTGKRIANMDENLAKLVGQEAYSNKLLDKITLKNTAEKLGNKINNNL